MPLKAVCSSLGKLLSIKTWLRRMYMRSNIGSLPTGQTSTQAPQAVQAQSADSLVRHSSIVSGDAWPAASRLRLAFR